MRRIFSSTGACVAFLLLSALVLCGLTWVTIASLQVETAQREATLRADRTTQERLALWRMDGLFLPVFGAETNRPFAHYSALHTAFPAVDPDLGNEQQNSINLRLPSPLLSTDLPNWMALHFQIDPEYGWESPQVLSGDLVDRLGGPPNWLSLQNVTATRQVLLAQLAQKFPKEQVLKQLDSFERRLDDQELFLVPAPLPPEPSTPKGGEGSNLSEARPQAPPSSEGLTRLAPDQSSQKKMSDSIDDSAPGKARELSRNIDLLRMQLGEKDGRFMRGSADNTAPMAGLGAQVLGGGGGFSGSGGMGTAQSGAQFGLGGRGGNFPPQNTPTLQSAAGPNSDYEKRDAITKNATRSSVENLPSNRVAQMFDKAAQPAPMPLGRVASPAAPTIASVNVASKPEATPMAPGRSFPGVPAPGAMPAPGGPGGGPQPVAPSAAPPGAASKAPATGSDEKVNDARAVDLKENKDRTAGKDLAKVEMKTEAVKSPEQKPSGETKEELNKHPELLAKQMKTPAPQNELEKRKALEELERESADKLSFYFSTIVAEPKAAPQPQPIAVQVGPLRSQWLSADDGSHYLILVRAARMEAKTIYQGIVLDWSQVQEQLQDLVQDIFPNSNFKRVLPGDTPNPELAMTILPVQLEPTSSPDLPSARWSPLRTGLALAWVSAITALLAVGFGGRALLDLSERRIRFVSAVTHELRTPLTSLRLYLDLLTSGMIEDPDKQKEYLNTLANESERLNRLIENVLDFARLEKRSLQASRANVAVSELTEQISQTWTERCASEGREFVVVSTVPVDQTILTDLRMAGQILGNLIDNARKYSRDSADPRIWLWVKPGERGRIVLEVEDRGPGVPARERSTIFRPFRRGNEADFTAGGAGLGLALAKQWAEMLGGSLTYRTPEGGIGACFRLELPSK
jgi:signal transduction histidine kinase